MSVEALLRGGALVAMHRNLTWRTARGMQLDTGAYLLGLEQAAGVPATIVGRPEPAMFRAGPAPRARPRRMRHPAGSRRRMRSPSSARSSARSTRRWPCASTA
jgi:hypothetical protein